MNTWTTMRLTVLVLLLSAFTAAAQSSGYGVDNFGNLYRIDLTSADATLIGPTGITILIEGIASDASGNLYATTVAGDLHRLDIETGAATLLGNHGSGDISGLDNYDGTLLGIEFSGGGAAQDIHAIAPDTVSSTVHASIDRTDITAISALTTANGNQAYFQGTLAPGVGTLFKLNVDTGETTQIGDLATYVTGLDFDGTRLMALAFGGRLFSIDPETADMNLIGTSAGGQTWLALDVPEKRVSTLECNGTGNGGDSMTFRQIRFTTGTSFDGVELRMEATAPGDYYFDAELRRSDGIIVQPERVVRGAAIGLAGNFASQPYQPVRIDFGPVPVAGTETFTLRMTNIAGPGGTPVFETFGFANEPCAGVEEIDTASPPPPSVVGDPAGFKLLANPHQATALLVCEMPGLMNGDNASSRGVRFTTDRDFRSAELRFNAATAGSFTFDVELRRSSGYLVTPERVASGLSVSVPGGLNVQPFRVVSIDFGDIVRVLGPETFTMKVTNISGLGGLLFETYGIGNTPCANVEETEENNVAVPTVRGDPAGYRLAGERDSLVPTLWCNSDGAISYSAHVRGIRFTTSVPFTDVELLMNGALPGEYTFTAELRRSHGFVVAPHSVIPGIVVDAPGDANAHPYTSVARVDFGDVPVEPGVYTLKFVDISGPTTSFFFDVNAFSCASGNVEATLENNVVVPTPLGYPAGFRLLLRPDADLDTIGDPIDNCVMSTNSDQRDTDMDGIGNVCDGDFNNDCVTNAIDLGIMKLNFFMTGDLVTDMNGDGVTNVIDLGLLKNEFFTAPGPAAAPNLCL